MFLSPAASEEFGTVHEIRIAFKSTAAFLMDVYCILPTGDNLYTVLDKFPPEFFHTGSTLAKWDISQVRILPVASVMFVDIGPRSFLL
jgi:hypothetical protein